jgi:6-phosphofructokinase 1
LNAAIRGAAIAALQRGWEVVGIKRGFAGLLNPEETVMVTPQMVRGITHLGGTILGTTNRGNPFKWPERQPDGSVTEVDRSDQVVAGVRSLGLDGLIVIGGDGTLRIALDLGKKGVPVVGVPKTIDNDVGSTQATFGFDTAVNTATEAIDKIRSTAEAHERVMVVEVMGRDAGWIALHSGLAGGVDVVLIPEIPYVVERVCRKIRAREAEGCRFSIVVVAEGAHPAEGPRAVRQAAGGGGEERLGGICERVAAEIAAGTGKETRTLTLGHLQRGGSPTTFDRLLALRFGVAATRAIAEGRFGEMVALRIPRVVTVPLTEALAEPKRVPLDHDLIKTARELGISFGD